jgi:SAM-dependent methyltransferase
MKKKPKRDWEDPYYRYTDGKAEITIDVTASIPTFTNPVDGLSDVVAQHFRRRHCTRILDFGAGKLRNTLYLLRKNYDVTAVEFGEAYDTPAAQKRMAQAKRFGGFRWMLPKDFLEVNYTFDAAIIVNVVNVVPDNKDRRKILGECGGRLRPGGVLLVMTQYGEPRYEPAATKRKSLGKGWCYNLHKKHKTYNIEFSLPELRLLVPRRVLKEIGPISSNHHRALLFEKQ